MINIPIWLFIVMLILDTPILFMTIAWIVCLITMNVADGRPSKKELEKAKECPDKLDPNYNPEYIEREK